MKRNPHFAIIYQCLIASMFILCWLYPMAARAQFIQRFSGTHFTEPINFDFWQRNLQSGMEMGRSYPVFFRPVSFDFSSFDSIAVFREADFHSLAFFRLARFYSVADFSEGQFHSAGNFGGTHFDSTADFRGTIFDSTAEFEKTSFHFTANFSDAKFHLSVNFKGAKFHRAADFKWAQFGGKVLLKRMSLPKKLDFRYVTDIARRIDFSVAAPPLAGGKCEIALTGADIDKIKLNMRLFRLWFPIDTVYKDSVVGDESWKVVDRVDSSSYDERIAVYASVLKKFDDDGLMESFEILDIEYRQLKYEHEGGLNWYVTDTFQRLWWNYGYNPERIFLWTIGLWVLFSLASLKPYPRLRDNVYTIAFLSRSNNNAVFWPTLWMFYWLEVMTYTATIFFGLKMDISQFKPAVIRNYPWLFAYLMLVYVVGLVCLGFIVNIIFTR